MYYFGICLLAILILLISNHDILFKWKENKEIPALNIYRWFLYSVLAFYTIDMSWGILEHYHLLKILYVATVLFFFLMAFSVLLWTKYVLEYLEKKSIMGKVLLIGGHVFVIYEIIAIIINFFVPIIFKFEGDEYVSLFARYITLGLQIILFFLVSIFTFVMGMSIRKQKASRYKTIGLFGLAMALAITLQMFFPLLPLYSIGFMLGTTILHSFVIEDEKEEYRGKLEESLARELKQRKELGSAMKLAYTDSLTGLNNKLAYLELEEKIEAQIKASEDIEFGVVVLDLNDLKLTNDDLGHEKGDEYLIKASALMKEYYKDSQIFRIGGDEFAIILEGEDYIKREDLVKEFNDLMNENLKENNNIIIALGMACFDKNIDSSYQDVFKRADKEMYKRKDELKMMKKSTI